MRSKVRAYSHQGHGPHADQQAGYIISDFRQHALTCEPQPVHTLARSARQPQLLDQPVLQVLLARSTRPLLLYTRLELARIISMFSACSTRPNWARRFKVPPACPQASANLIHYLLCRFLHRPGFLFRLRSFDGLMDQISSLPHPPFLSHRR